MIEDERTVPAGIAAEELQGLPVPGVPAEPTTGEPTTGEPRAREPMAREQVAGERAAGEEPPERSSDRRSARGLRGVLAVIVVSALVGAGAAVSVARLTGWGRQTVVNRYVQPNTSAIDSRPADIQGILLNVLPGVVSITATSSASTPFFGPGTGASTTATGTGVIVSSDGEVITNDHVVSGATSVAVTLNDSTEALPAAIVGESPGDDLALLRIQGAHDLTPVAFGDSDRTVVGDDVLAVGYALGLSGGPTVTDGIVSAKGREVSTQTSSGASITLQNMLQTDAAISSGNSGGPLVDSSSKVIGINTVVAASSRSTTAQNIGFAIPSRTVESFLARMRQG